MEFISWSATGATPYTESGWVNMVPLCNGWLAINTGTDPVKINDHILYPGTPGTNNGDSLPYGGNLGEIYEGTIKIEFMSNTGPRVTIDQKYYMTSQKTVLQNKIQ